MPAKFPAAVPDVQAASFLPLVADQLVAVEEVFRSRLQSDVPLIDEAGAYIADGGGKRVRPALLLLAAQILDRDNEEAVTYAAVVELIHTATLIHDDVVDHSGLRRGQETPNRKWGNSRTVLLGDWVYTSAMHLALKHGNVEVLRALVQATLRMTEGELLTLERRGARDLSLDEYYQIIRRKTAHLFSAACYVPSLMAPTTAETGQALQTYGMELGLCFQIKDDLLDFTSESATVGKPTLADLREGKLTLPVLLMLPRLTPGERGAVFAVLEDGGFERTSEDFVLELVAREGTIEETERRASEHGRAAREAILKLPSCPARDALEAAPDFLLHRRS